MTLPFLPDEPSPFDQADGFRDDAADRLPVPQVQVDAATHRFLSCLQQCAIMGQWDFVRRQLKENEALDIPFHELSLRAFRAAAAAGKMDIVETLFARNFRLPRQEGMDAVEYCAAHYPGTSLSVVSYLLKNGYAAPDSAIRAVAGCGEPSTMNVFHKAGCDVLQGGSFSYAFHTGNISMMSYLYAHGADLYRPSVVAGLHGGLQSFHDKNRDSVVTTSTTAIASFYKGLVDTDRETWLGYYAATAGHNPGLEGFREVPDGVADRGMTLLQVAARAGCFADIMAAASAETQKPLTAADLLRRDAQGTSALDVLAARGEVETLFDPRLWFRNPGEAVKLHAALKDLGADVDIDAQGFTTEMQRLQLKARATAKPLKLRQGPK